MLVIYKNLDSAYVSGQSIEENRWEIATTQNPCFELDD